MAIINSTVNQPSYYQPAFGPIVYGVLSDNITQVDFRYIFSVYVDNILASTIKQMPNPSGYGIVDIAPVVQPYIDCGDSVEYEVTIAQGGSLPFKNLLNQYVRVKVFAGEEFRTSPEAPLILYTGIGNSPGGPRIPLSSNLNNAGYIGLTAGYVSLTASNSYSCIVLPSAFDQESSYLHSVPPTNTNQYPLGIYSDRVFPSVVGSVTGSTGSWQAGVGMSAGSPKGRFLTDLTTHHVYLQDHMTLTFLGLNPLGYGAGGTVTPSAPDNFFVGNLLYRFFDENEAIIATWDLLVNNVSFQGGVKTDNCGATAPGNTEKLHLEACRCGPADIAVRLAQAMADGAIGYTVDLRGSNTSGSCGSILISETHKFYVHTCPPTFPRVRVSWLNYLGGRDWFNFDKYVEVTSSQKSNTYYKDPNQWSGTSWSLRPWAAGDRIYSKDITRRIKVTTDWLTEDEVTYLKGLFNTVQANIWLPGRDNSYPIPVRADSSTFTVVDQILSKDKLQSISFELAYASPNRTQTT